MKIFCSIAHYFQQDYFDGPTKLFSDQQDFKFFSKTVLLCVALIKSIFASSIFD